MSEESTPTTVRIETPGITVELSGDGATPDSAFELWSRVMGQWRDRLEAGSFGFGGSDNQVGAEIGALAVGDRATDGAIVRQHQHGGPYRVGDPEDDPTFYRRSTV